MDLERSETDRGKEDLRGKRDRERQEREGRLNKNKV